MSLDRSDKNAGPFRVAVLIGIYLMVALLCAPALRAQVSPDEHASHHPGQSGGATPAAGAMPTAGSMSATPGTAPDMGSMPPAGAIPRTSAAPSGGPGGMEGMGGGAGGMGAMMKGMMGGMPQKELYPTLMALPVTTADQRLQLQQQADARANLGTALLRQAAARMANPQASDLELQEAAADARTGLREMESGQAARRALAEGRVPRAIALQWFQTEMNLQRQSNHGPQSDMWFHLVAIAILAAFAIAMVAMYFFKMRRAAELFGRIESNSGAPPPGSAPPLAGTPAPSAAPVPKGVATNAKH